MFDPGINATSSLVENLSPAELVSPYASLEVPSHQYCIGGLELRLHSGLLFALRATS